ETPGFRHSAHADRAPTASRNSRRAAARALRRRAFAGARASVACRIDGRGVARHGGGRAVLRRACLQAVVAARRIVARADHLPERLHVARELPDLLDRQLVAEGWHAVRASVADGGDEVDQIGAVEPIAVDQRRPGAAAALGVTSAAVEPGIEPLALAELIGVALV